MRCQGLLVSAMTFMAFTLDDVWGLSQPSHAQKSTTTTASISAASFLSSCTSPETTTSMTATTGRRNLFALSLASAGSIFLANANPALAAAKDPYEADKQKLLAGYKRLNYLLDNWVQETSDCKTKTQYSSASSPCERTPLKVQDYLGYKSMDDPLFRADKTMRRLESLVSTDDTVDYLEAMEKFSEKAEEGTLLLCSVVVVYGIQM